MRTRSEALVWIAQQKDKLLDFDGKYGGQCVDLFNFYWQFLGIPVQWFDYAKQAWDHNYPNVTRFDKPEPGDVAVWGSEMGFGFGHVALVMSVHPSGVSFQSMDENYYNFDLAKGAPCEVVEHDMRGILGFLRPNFNPEPNQSAPAPAAPVAQPAGSTYAIQKNDTFWGLEEALGLAHGTLESLNPGQDPRTLQIGQVIMVKPAGAPAATPAQKTYTIVPDDTFWDLEEHFGWAHGTLQNMNPGQNPRTLQIGQQINIPG